ncbi:hypothetical protein [Streptomyces canus]|uniref:zinc finger domain-containing protein n=1 Tax=Streptomyces canus TaxID=58343 RepID=UPI0038638812|nr:helix-turn-helix domain-containing protein [Streptomyces canus]
MSAAALAAFEAAPLPQPPRAAAGVRPRDGGLTVRVPLRLVVGVQYSDAALAVYVKVAALALRPEGCTAKVAVLAEYLGMSKSAAERGLRALARPDTIDGLVEVPTVRRTLRGGRGQSAHRVVRPLAECELWVRIPVRAAEALTPRLLRLYALLAYSTARRIPVTAAELGEMLRHHTGQRAGEHLGERQARRLVDDLEATGWLTVRRREGEQGRHAYETHRHPLRSVPAAPEAAALEEAAEQLPLWEAGSPVVYDGSGPGDHDGSLASKEDHPTDRPEETQPVGVSRRRRGDRTSVAAPVDNASGIVPDTFRPDASRAPRGNRLTPATPTTPYAGPELRWTMRIHESLAPVRHLLDGASRFMLRRVARDIGRQLDDAARTLMTPQRMAARIAARYRDARTIGDVGAWLLAVAVVPQGCGLPLCEDGSVWPTGERCETCAHQRQITSEQWRQARAWDERLAELGRDQALAKATYRQRTAATDAEVLAVAAERGPAAALHRYGVLRAGELLRAAYGELPDPPPAVPRPAPPVPRPRVIEEAPMRDDYMPAEFRSAVGRAELSGALTVACPVRGCLADEGQPCTTPRGRRRTEPHTDRTAAAAARGEES